MTEREFDLVLLGATGFVGRLTAEHLAAHAPAGLRVGLAGRRPDGLAVAREELGAGAQDWPLVRADLAEEASVRALAHRSRVVVSTAGPYAPRGLPLVAACAAAGTAYADLTGETLFVHRSIAAAHERAQATRARIVHSCGFDSVPADLGVGLAAARARAEGAGPLRAATLHVRSMRGGVSGGTVDSLRQQTLEVRGDRELRAVAADPLALTGARRRRTGSRGRLIRRDLRTGRWSAPFAMGAFNRQIVQRSNALADWAYGVDFSYREVVDTGRGLLGAATAVGLTAGTALLLGAMALAPPRRLLDVVLPDPGEGPRPEPLDRGRFAVAVEAVTVTGARYRTRIAAPLDPGYRGTAVMLGEAGVSLAVDDLPTRGGVLTPMTALGEALAVRLRARGLTVSTERFPE